MVEQCRAGTNVSVVRYDKYGNTQLVSRTHNAVLTSGLNLLAQMANGTAFEIAGFGLGSSSTAVQASDTWLKTALLVTDPTSTLYESNLFRATLYLDESQLNGDNISEAIIATGVTNGVDIAYARVVIPTISKTSDYAYLFIFDCTWGSK